MSSRAMTASPGSDGLIHVTYSVDTTNQAIAGPIVAAVQAWNAQKGNTGVEFDPVGPGAVADLQIEFGTETACAAYDSQKRAIFYTDYWEASNAQSMIIQHELGHYLGLADAGLNPNPPSIMNNPSNTSLRSGCENPTVNTTTIQPTDVATIPTCRSGEQAYQKMLATAQRIFNNASRTQFTILPPYTAPSGISCTYVYSTVNFYVDGVYDSSETVVSQVICE